VETAAGTTRSSGTVTLVMNRASRRLQRPERSRRSSIPARFPLDPPAGHSAAVSASMTPPVHESGDETVVSSAPRNDCAVKRLALNDQAPLAGNDRRDTIRGNDDRVPPEYANTQQNVVRHIDARSVEDTLNQADPAAVRLHLEACALSEPVVAFQSRRHERARLFHSTEPCTRPPNQHPLKSTSTP
jgi:hypothetical protein